MTSVFHAGEQAVQAMAGVRAEADRLEHMLGPVIKPAAQEFLQNQSLAIASTVDSAGNVWASPIIGEPGFVKPLSEQSVQVNALPVVSDPFHENLRTGGAIGLLVIDLATRRRVRINGDATIQSDGSIHIHTKQVYFNCPKYIQIRRLKTSNVVESKQPEISRASSLTIQQQQWIAQADTFFIASFHPESGADASHRGGNPGFVHALDSNKLLFPDYSGNNMFNTLGNLSVNPQAGLLFINFETGSTLQLTGKTQIIWDAERIIQFIGAERLIEFEISQAISIDNAIPFRWSFGNIPPTIQP